MLHKSETVTRNHFLITDFSSSSSVIVQDLTFASQILIFMLSESNSVNSSTNHVCGALHADLSTTSNYVKYFKERFERYVISRHALFKSRDPNTIGIRRCLSLNDHNSLQNDASSRLMNPSPNSGNKQNSGFYSTLPRPTQKRPLSSKTSLQNCPTLTNSSENCQPNVSNYNKPVFTRALSSERVHVRRSSINGQFLQSLSDLHNRSFSATPTQPNILTLNQKPKSSEPSNKSSRENSGPDSAVKIMPRPQNTLGVTRSLSLHRKKFNPNSLHVEVLSSRIRQTSECSAVTDGDSGVVSDTNSISENTASGVGNVSAHNPTHIKSNAGSDATLTPNDTLNTVDLEQSTLERTKPKVKLENMRVVLFHKDGLIFDCFIDLLRDLPDVEIHHFPLIQGKKTRIIVNHNCNIDFEIVHSSS
ncbi:uncharacterized protein LOC142344779 [Convolutriloba macropyga]|uniref:uncharacterized protein LOC142344779 n=1 Tax=Convolutriloba macropyga TaxID=536237 RepID=UPI003F51F1AB